MKTGRKIASLAALVAGLIAALTVLALIGFLAPNDGARAQAPTVSVLGIDVDPTGNSCPADGIGDCTLGVIDQCKSVPLDEAAYQYDVFFRGIPTVGSPFNNFAAAAYDVNFVAPVPPLGNMTAQDHTTPTIVLQAQAPGSAVSELSELVPDMFPPHSTNFGDVGVAEQNPPFTQGVLGRYTLDLTGVPPGLYSMTFVPGSTIVANDMGLPIFDDPSTPADDDADGAINEDQVWDANFSPPYGLVAVGLPCPAPADLKNIGLQAQGIVSDQDLEVSTDYWFQLAEIVHNNGPETNPSVLVSTRMTPAGGSEVLHRVTEADQEVLVDDAPLNCTAPGAPPVFCTNNVVNGVAPVSTEIRVDPGYALEVIKRLALPMSIPTQLTQDWGIHCLEPSIHVFHWESTIERDDPYSVDPDPSNNSLSLDLAVNCITEADVKVVSQAVTSAPPAKVPLPYPTLYVGAGADVQIQSTVHNNGPWGPTDVQVMRQVTIPNQAPFYLGMDPVEFPNTCTIAPAVVYSQQVLPTSVPTNVTNTYTITCGTGGIEWDDDEDGMVDEDPVNMVDDDGDTTTDEDSPFYMVTPAFVTSIDNPKDPHVVDPDMTNNSLTYAGLHLFVIRPFTPEGTLTVDDADPSVDTAPVSDVCVAGSAFACKTLNALSIPASPPGSQPLALTMNLKGDAPGEWWQANANGVANGEKVGKIDYTVVANPIPMAMSCATGVPIVGSLDLWDAALPPAGYLGIPNGQYVPDTFPGMPVDWPGRQEALFPGPFHGPGGGELSWSSTLDGAVKWVLTYVPAPSAKLWARYVGLTAPPVSTPVNVLTFDLSGVGAGPFLAVGLTGEWGAPPLPTWVPFCSPFTADVLILGTTPGSGELIQYCAVANSPAHPQHTAISMFQRSDIGEIDQVVDTFTCAPPPDTDGDTIDDVADNCPLVPNPDQTDTDSDGIGDVCDTDEADLKKLDLQAQGIQNDQNVDASVTYAFQLTDIIHNNGPENLVPALSKTSISPPSGFTISHRVTMEGTEEVCLNSSCSFPPEGTVTSAGAGDLLEVIEHVSLPVSLTHQLAQEWEAHCLEPSTHVLHWQSTIEADGAYPDPDPNNDSRVFDLAVNCIGPADVKVMATYASQMPPPMNPPIPLPTIVIGEDTPLEMTTIIHNNGPIMQVDADLISSSTVVAYPGGDPSRWSTWGNHGCTLTPALSHIQASLPVSSNQSIVQGYTINCDMGGIGRDDDADTFVDEDYVGGVGYDADGDGVVDEDACDGVDDDADTVTDEDPPNGDEDCDGLIDEDSAFYVVAVSFETVAQLKDPHTVDPILDNNSAQTTVFMAVVRPFTPTYSFTIDNMEPDQQTNPTSDICVSGLPCKSLMDLSIPNIPPPAGPPAGQPLAAIMPVIGSQAGQWSLASGLDIPNGETVGKAEYSFRLSIGGLTPDRCDLQVAGTSELYDACLPPPGDPYIPRSYLGEPSCAFDLPTQQDAMAPPNAFNSWSHSLDFVVRWLYTLQPTAYLWDRYSGYNAMLGMPINVLVFDLSGGTGVGPWMRMVVAADPTQRTSLYMCAPFDAHLLFLGQTPTSSIPILTCEQPGFQTNPLVLERNDVGTIISLEDTAVCMAAEDDVSCELTKDEAPQVGIGLDYSETVAVTIQNGIGPDEVAVELTLVSPLDCPAVWDPATVPVGSVVDPPVVEGPNQTSRARWQEPAMAPYEVRVRNVDYIVNCSAGSYSLQITQDVSPTSVPDPNPGNNECVNQPLVTASEDDVDDDTVVNWLDNCPYVPNPDQTDTDATDQDGDTTEGEDAVDDLDNDADTRIDEDPPGDALGDACDPDDDNDGIDDASDNCPLAVNLDQLDTDGDAIGDACDLDNDNDGVLDDGDDSGVAGDSPCSGGQTAGCDDNCRLVWNSDQMDSDADGIGDACAAGAFSPQASIRLSGYNSSANADVTSNFAIPLDDLFFDGAALLGFSGDIAFHPPEWGVAADAGVPDGTVVGELSSVVTLGLLNGACANHLSVHFTLVDATANTGTVFTDTGEISSSWNGYEPVCPGGKERAVCQWPGFLSEMFPGVTPRARYYGHASVAGIQLVVNILLFEPGASLPNYPSFPSDWGYASLTVLNNPTTPYAPASLNDICSPLESDYTITGSGDGFTVRTNPPYGGAYMFRSWSRGARDNDGDGYENGIDTCPWVANLDGNIRSTGVLNPDQDGIDSACDPDPTSPCGPGPGDDPAAYDCDADGYMNRGDNCPFVVNADQRDTDEDGLGDDCDPQPDTPFGDPSRPTVVRHVNVAISGPPPCGPDTDGDGVGDLCDTCPLLPNPEQTDTDGDGAGDACDGDDDNDTILDGSDNCPLAANSDQTDTDGDALGDVCDPDDDDDTVDDLIDNCPLLPNPGQADIDGDGLGDACDNDSDNDGFTDGQENSLGSDPLDPGSTPEHISLPWTCTDGIDNDLDGLPDLFDCDNDGDGIATYFDACPFTAEDMDGYQDGDGCPDTDNDMDGVCDPWFPPGQLACTGSDSCTNVAEDADSFHDTDGCPDPDNDGDGFPDHTDQCPATDWTVGPDGIADTGDEPLGQNGVPIKTKEDYDGVIDVDGCHDSPGDDWDGDGIADEVEVFVAGTNPMDMDSDDDGLCDGSAPPVCGSEDLNKNGIVDPGETDPMDPDSDGDGLTDGMERGLAQPETPGTNMASPNWHPDSDPSTTTNPLSPDTDGDTLPDGVEDADHDGRKDRGETNPASADTDRDGYGDTADNCPAANNPGQEDFDSDDIGDRCDDSDADAFTDYVEFFVGCDPVDACPDNSSDPAWPPDMNNDRTVNINDVLTYAGKIAPNYDARYDLDANGSINILDILLYGTVVGLSCTNP